MDLMLDTLNDTNKASITSWSITGHFFDFLIASATKLLVSKQMLKKTA